MRGRKPKSEIRQNIINILYIIGKAHAYEIAKIYNKIFPKVSVRVIYYHLKKGVSLGEFIIEDIKINKADYSWGDSAERIYYSLGEKANPKIEKELYDKIKNTYKSISKSY